MQMQHQTVIKRSFAGRMRRERKGGREGWVSACVWWTGHHARCCCSPLRSRTSGSRTWIRKQGTNPHSLFRTRCLISNSNFFHDYLCPVIDRVSQYISHMSTTHGQRGRGSVVSVPAIRHADSSCITRPLLLPHDCTVRTRSLNQAVIPFIRLLLLPYCHHKVRRTGTCFALHAMAFLGKHDV